MKLLHRIISAIAATAALASCHHVEEYDGGMYGNFDALWSVVDEHYCFFAFNVSYYRRWWSDYPQNFDRRLVQQYYLDFDYAQSGPLSYKVLHDSIGYMLVSSMASGIPHGALDVSLLSFAEADCPALVIDVRDNGGGMMTTTERLVCRFIDNPILAGYISHKTGPAHDAFSDPYPFHYEPATGHVRWLRPVVILTNRSTFSKVDLDPEKALKGTDTMLDFALDLAADWREWYRKPE